MRTQFWAAAIMVLVCASSAYSQEPKGIKYGVEFFQTPMFPEPVLGADIIQLQPRSKNSAGVALLKRADGATVWASDDYLVTLQKTTSDQEFIVQGLKAGTLKPGETLRLTVVAGIYRRLTLYGSKCSCSRDTGWKVVKELDLQSVIITPPSVALPEF